MEASQSVAEPNTQQEKRFQAWVERLKSALKGVGADDASLLSDEQLASVVELIQTSLREEKRTYPRVNVNMAPVVNQMLSSADTLQSRIQRLSLPKASHRFDVLKDHLSSTKALSSIDVQPMKRSFDAHEQRLRQFFETLENDQASDVLVNMCKLVDASNRAVELKDRDENYLQKWQRFEERRHESNKQALEVTNQKLEYLQGRDKENLITSSKSSLGTQLTSSQQLLVAAEEEEEKARMIYEAAIEKTRLARHQVDDISKFSETITTQSEILSRVTAIRAQLEAYNLKSSAQRLTILSSLDSAFNVLRQRVVDQRLRHDLPVLLQNLNALFQSALEQLDSDYHSTEVNSELTSENAERPVSAYCAVRIGLESLQLWRRLQLTPVLPQIESLLGDFDRYLQSLVQRLPDEPLRSVNASETYKDSTVVLHFSHIVHSTPSGHVENQLRVDSCIRMLTKKQSTQARTLSMLAGRGLLGSVANATNSTRTLVLNKCNDVLSPPLWVLPLVHGPQYLAQLWRCAEEAKRDDLFVPLEFESEWETDDDSVDGDLDVDKNKDSEKPRSRRGRWAKKNHLVDDIVMNDSIREQFGEEKTRKLMNLLSPRYGDGKLAQALRIVQPKAPTAIRGRRVRVVGTDKTSDSETESDDENDSQNKQQRVETPFGNGVLVVSELSRRDSDMVQIRLDWGATGYFNPQCVKLLSKRKRQRFSATTSDMVLRAKSVRKPRATIKREPTDETSVDPFTTDRFLHTNFTIHRIVRRILALVGVQKLLVDRVHVKDAHLSLWLHGRTSPGNTRNIENSLLTWLTRYRRADLEALLDAKEKLIKQTPAVVPDSGLTILNELAKLEVPSGPDFSDASVNSYASPNEARETLRQEGFAYSASRLLKKSGEQRARVKRRRTSMNGGEGGTRSAPTSSGSKGPPRTPRKRHVVDISFPQLGFTEYEQGILRLIFIRLGSALNMNQTVFASQIAQRCGIATTQTGVSGWIHNRVSKSLHAALDCCVFYWINQHFLSLSKEDQQVWGPLRTKYSAVVAAAVEKVILEHAQRKSGESVEPTTPSQAADDSMAVSDDDFQVAKLSDVESEQEFHDTPTPASPPASLDHDEVIEETGAVESSHEMDVVDQIEPTPDAAQSSSEELISESEQEEETPALPSSGHCEVKSGPALSGPSTPQARAESDLESMSEDLDNDDSDDGVVESAQSNKELLPFLQKEFLRVGKLFTAEQERRQLTHSYIAFEATRLDIKLTQPAISRFIRDKFVGVAGGRVFLNSLCKWIAYSRTKGVASSPFGADGNSCSSCGKSRNAFHSQKDFLVHVGNCSVESGNVSKAVFLDSYPLSGPLNYIDWASELVLIDEQLRTFESNGEEAVAARCLPEECFVCKLKDSALQRCQFCRRSFHGSCSASSQEGSCALCEAHLSSELVEFASRDGSVGKRLQIFDDSSNQWQRCVVAASANRNSKLLLLLKMFATNTFQWIDSADHVLLHSKADFNNNSRRKRGRQVSSSSASASKPVTSEGVGRGRSRRFQSTGDQVSSLRNATDSTEATDAVMTDTYISAQSLRAALCTAGSACQAVDIVLTNANCNAFVCARPPGHHAGRYGCTRGCLGTGFCILNNAAIALTYARVRWGLQRVAIVDFDVHFGNGTADIVRGNPDAFFASVHMTYGPRNDGRNEQNSEAAAKCDCGFFPSNLGVTEISDNYISVGVQPAVVIRAVRGRQRTIKRAHQTRREVKQEEDEDDEDDDTAEDGSPVADDAAAGFEELGVNIKKEVVNEAVPTFVGATGFVSALRDVIIPRLEKYQPQLLIISAGFDGCSTDPLGSEMGLDVEDFTVCTSMLMACMQRVARTTSDPRGGRIVSLLEGGYDIGLETKGLARCVDAHVSALQDKTVFSSIP